MNYENIRHKIKWDTKFGDLYRWAVTVLGLKFLRAGRRLLKNSMGRCSWCGANCGLESTVSRKGLRCSSLDRDCTNKPSL